VSGESEPGGLPASGAVSRYYHQISWYVDHGAAVIKEEHVWADDVEMRVAVDPAGSHPMVVAVSTSPTGRLQIHDPEWQDLSSTRLHEWLEQHIARCQSEEFRREWLNERTEGQ
jgi:hypothetical protein